VPKSESNTTLCPVCSEPLDGKKRYCSDRCRLWAHNEKKVREMAEIVYAVGMRKFKRPVAYLEEKK